MARLTVSSLIASPRSLAVASYINVEIIQTTHASLATMQNPDPTDARELCHEMAGPALRCDSASLPTARRLLTAFRICAACLAPSR